MESVRNEPELDELTTEAWDRESADLDLRSTDELVALMNDVDATVPAAVARAHESLVAAIDVVVDALDRRGRLVYVGAGTSGRLALADAVEMRATFGLEQGRVLALVAGATEAAESSEAAEDDADAGARELLALDPGPDDVVVGVSASGRTPYVLAALAAAREAGAATVAVVCVEGSELGALAHHEVAVVVGSELIAGSTRLKAGTAQKLVLNTISTVSMIRLGRTYGNLMVDVAATNEKRRARARRLVGLAPRPTRERVTAALDDAAGDAKLAILMLRADLDVTEARERLERSGGALRKALEQ